MVEDPMQGKERADYPETGLLRRGGWGPRTARRETSTLGRGRDNFQFKAERTSVPAGKSMGSADGLRQVLGAGFAKISFMSNVLFFPKMTFMELIQLAHMCS